MVRHWKGTYITRMGVKRGPCKDGYPYAMWKKHVENPYGNPFDISFVCESCKKIVERTARREYTPRPRGFYALHLTPITKKKLL